MESLGKLLDGRVYLVILLGVELTLILPVQALLDDLTRALKLLKYSSFNVLLRFFDLR